MMVSLADLFQGISLLVFGKLKRSRPCPTRHREIQGQSCRGSSCFPRGFLRNWNRSHPRLSMSWIPGYHRPHSLSFQNVPRMPRLTRCLDPEAVFSRTHAWRREHILSSGADPAVSVIPESGPRARLSYEAMGGGLRSKRRSIHRASCHLT